MKLGENSIFEIEEELDKDGELCVDFEGDYDQTSASTYIDREEAIKLAIMFIDLFEITDSELGR